MNSREAWFSLLDAVRANGRQYTDQEGRLCKELTNNVLTIDDTHDAIELVRELQRYGNWVYPTPEELRSVVIGGTGEGAHEYSYAPRLFSGMNQIDDFIIPLLRENPQSRRGLVVLYQPEHDSDLSSTNVPGFVSMVFRVLADSLDLTCHLRSNDVLVGLPANLYQLRSLQEYVSGKLGLACGAIHVISSSAHFFPLEYEEDYQALMHLVRRRNTLEG